MNCPVDNTPMTGGAQGTMRYEACPHCRGLWVNTDTLAAAHPPVFVLFKNLPGIEALEEDPDVARQCHACHVGLIPRTVGSTTVDICPRCGHIWLGAGEFDRVAGFYRSRPRTEWPRVSQLEAAPAKAGPPRDRSGLPKGIRASAGRPRSDPGDTEPEDPQVRMKRALDLLGDLVKKGLTE